MPLPMKMKCINCGKEYPVEIYYRRCPSCSGILHIYYDYEQLRARKNELINIHEDSMWRYKGLLPIQDLSNVISLKEGWTPLIKARRLSQELKLKNILLKDETRNPSGSFLDRGISLEVSIAAEYGFKSLTCGSTGNLAASVAAYGAKGGFKTIIYVPRRVELGKLYQIAIYGADIYIVNSYEEALRRSEMMFLDSFVITTSDPWYLEGIKTIAFEILEQFKFDPPDYIITSAGTGSLLSMTYKGFEEMHLMEFINDFNTSFIAVQSEKADPIAKAFRAGKNHVEPIEGSLDTVALDIAINNPTHGDIVLDIVHKTNGYVLSVSDEEILGSLSLLAKLEGILAEPSAAAVLAGLKRLADEGKILPSESVVLIITGAGLKHPKAIRDTVSKVITLRRILSIVEGERELSRLGTTKIKILQAIAEGHTYGYAIWKVLRDKYGVKVGLPTLYQHLKELEKMDLITVFSEESDKGRKSIHYTLTHKGQRIVEDFA